MLIKEQTSHNIEHISAATEVNQPGLQTGEGKAYTRAERLVKSVCTVHQGPRSEMDAIGGPLQQSAKPSVD